MSDTNTSGPAFPTWEQDEYGLKFFNEGMTLRQYAAIKLKVPDSGTDWLDEMITKSLQNDFAAKAMQGLFASNAPHDHDDAEIFAVVAEAAYKQANAMLKVSEA
jgi:hypothetical protein